MAPHYQTYDHVIEPVIDRAIMIYQSIGPFRLPTWDDYEYIKAEAIRLYHATVHFIISELPVIF